MSYDPFEEPIEEATAVEVVPGVPVLKTKEDRELALKEVEDRLLAESTKIVEGVLRFHEIDPTAEEPPEEWIEKHGYEVASSMHRLAVAGWVSKVKAPAGVDIAARVMLGIQKARSLDKAPKKLNVQLIQVNLTQETRVYEPLEEDTNE